MLNTTKSNELGIQISDSTVAVFPGWVKLGTPPSGEREIPSNYVSINTDQVTDSSSFSDIPGLSTTVSIDSSAYLYASLSFQSDSTGLDSTDSTDSIGGFRVVIHDSTGDELQRYIYGSEDIELGSVKHRAGLLDSGTYTVRGQFRRVSGDQTVRVNAGQLYTQALQSSGSSVPIGSPVGAAEFRGGRIPFSDMVDFAGDTSKYQYSLLYLHDSYGIADMTTVVSDPATTIRNLEYPIITESPTHMLGMFTFWSSDGTSADLISWSEVQ